MTKKLFKVVSKVIWWWLILATISKTLRLKALLSQGYFPAELPPPFVTETFARNRTSIYKKWSALGDFKKSSYEQFNYPRIGRQRRKLALVNPIPQLFLSHQISENWIEIQKILNSSKVSLDIPTIQIGNGRATPTPNFESIEFKRLEVSAEFNHILVSDISRFYGSIYTHVVPWAIHRKSWSKTNMHKPIFKKSFGNQLDIFLRKAQDNQTIGIPIGPDTSRIISELVAIAAEKAFSKEAKLSEERVFRYVDDWFIGYDGAGEAEDAVAHLAKACGIFRT